ncbi:MAG TPA: glycosyltransferase family 2 protein [Terriglobia bacterium]|nr:glycosyltransferase family 2 protein [Terriglobia bacterium]
MNPLTIAFLVLAILLVVQSVGSLRQGFQFLSLARRSRKRSPGDYHPLATVIIPCKGWDTSLEQNAARFSAQDYPRYQVLFVVAAENDAAFQPLAAMLASQRKTAAASGCAASLIIADFCEGRGEKVNNLLAGLTAAGPECEVLVFADIDARPSKDWLRFLVAPLADAPVTMTTGFRWYLPGASFTSRLRAAWDTSIATMMGDHPHNFAWGGSMAIRAADFRRLQVAERYWQHTVSDDYAITRAVRDGGGSIRFEPRCLVLSENDGGFRAFLRWTNRQIIITRVYASRFWKLGLASFGLYALTFFTGLAVILVPAMPASHRVMAAIFLAVILGLGMAKGAIRTVAAREMFPEEETRLQRYGACYWKFAPLVPWVMIFNFVFAAFVRRIEWRGTAYDLESQDRVRIIHRSSPLSG